MSLEFKPNYGRRVVEPYRALDYSPNPKQIGLRPIKSRTKGPDATWFDIMNKVLVALFVWRIINLNLFGQAKT